MPTPPQDNVVRKGIPGRTAEVEPWRYIKGPSGTVTFYPSEAELHPLNARDLLFASGEIIGEVSRQLKTEILPDLPHRLEPTVKEMVKALELATKAAQGAAVLTDNAHSAVTAAFGGPSDD